MKTRFFCYLAASFALTPALTLRAADEKAAPPAAPAAAGANAAKPAKPALEKGMTAEQVIKLIGKPTEIRPISVEDAGGGKAERWVYRRDGGTRIIQVPIGTREVPAFVGMVQEANQQHRSEVIYGPKTIRIFNVTSLLMVNDQLVLARQTQEAEERY